MKSEYIMKVKLLVSIAAVILVTGCASTQQNHAASVQQAVALQQAASSNEPQLYKLQNYKGPEAMDSNELAMHSRECVLSKLRPRVTYVSVRAEAGKILVPVSVNCEPYVY